MNERVIAQYCKAVGKMLVCGRAQKKRLLDGLAQELSEEFSLSSVTNAQLIAQVGAPAFTAEQLQESVEPAERAAFEKKRIRTLIAATVVAFVLLTICSIGYLASVRSQEPVYYKEYIQINPPYIYQGDITWGK